MFYRYFVSQYSIQGLCPTFLPKNDLKVFEDVTFRVSKRKRLFAEPLGCLKGRHDERVMYVAEEALEIIYFFISQIKHSFQTLCPICFA